MSAKKIIFPIVSIVVLGVCYTAWTAGGEQQQEQERRQEWAQNTLKAVRNADNAVDQYRDMWDVDSTPAEQSQQVRSAYASAQQALQNAQTVFSQGTEQEQDNFVEQNLNTRSINTFDDWVEGNAKQLRGLQPE